MTEEYTLKDVIVYPEDPRLIVGDRYYFANSPSACLAGARGRYPAEVLDGIAQHVSKPFVSGQDSWQCAIRKKDSERKYIPYDFENVTERESLMGKIVKYKNREEWDITGMIVGVEYMNSTYIIRIAGYYGITAEELLNKWVFTDGRPCGKEID